MICRLLVAEQNGSWLVLYICALTSKLGIARVKCSIPAIDKMFLQFFKFSFPHSCLVKKNKILITSLVFSYKLFFFYKKDPFSDIFETMPFFLTIRKKNCGKVLFFLQSQKSRTNVSNKREKLNFCPDLLISSCFNILLVFLLNYKFVFFFQGLSRKVHTCIGECD